MSSKYKMNVQEIDVQLVDKWDDNPNAMSDEEFNALCDELDQNGLIDPIQVVGPHTNGRYFILGGHHRFDAARVLGWEKLSCVLLDPTEWGSEKVEFQNIKMNVLKGKLSADKMMRWYQDKAKLYNAETLAKLTGFTNIDAFLKIVGELKKSIGATGLPEDLKNKVSEALSEMKTVDDLASVLHKIFNEYGDQLKYNFLTYTFGGLPHLYVLCNKKTWKSLQEIKKHCLDNELDINLVFAELLPKFKEASDNVTPGEKFEVDNV